MAVDRPELTTAGHRSGRVAAALLAVPVLFLGALFAWPLAAILDLGLRPDGRADAAALTAVITDPALRGVLWFSAWQAAASTVLTLVVALPAAWVFARLRFRGRQVLWAALIVPFVLPTVVVAGAFTSLFGVDGPVNELLRSIGIGSLRDPALQPQGALWAVLVAHAFFNYAVIVRTVGAAWGSLDRKVEESAAVLGASRWRVLREVTLPLLGPSVLAACSVVYLFTFTSFGVVLLLGESRLRTVEVEIYEQVRSLQLGTAAGLALAQLLAVGVLLVIAGRVQQRWALSLRPATEGARPPRGWGERGALLATLISMALLLGAPLVALAERSVQTSSGWGLQHYRALGEARGVLFVSPAEAIRNSLVIGAAATAVALTVGVLAVSGLVTLERGRRRSGGPRLRRVAAFDALLMLPLGASAVTVGLGFLVGLDRPPLDLRDSVLLVPLAQALVAIPFVVRTLLPAARSVDHRLRDAAAVLGASPLRVWWEVDRALLVRPLVVAAGFALAVSLGEFGATVLLARPDVPTLPLVVQRLLGQPGAVNRGQAMAVATILMGVTVVVMLAVERVRVRGADG